MKWVSIWLATPSSQPMAVEEAHERAVSVPHEPKDFSLVEVGLWIAKTCAWLVDNRRHYDIIHILGGYYWALPFVIVGRLLAKPTIVKIISGEIDLASHDTLVRRLRVWILRRSEVVVVLTEHARQLALDVGFRSAQLRQIPNGVDFNRLSKACHERERLRAEFGIVEDCFVVLYVGQVGHRKGVDRLLEAWREFRRSALGPVRLILVGAPDGSVDLRAIATDDLYHVGHVNEPHWYYCVADSFVLLSRSEGMANVLLEATAAGIPIIVSDIPPNRELASQFGGLVASGSDDQMASEAADHLRVLERMFREQLPARNEKGQSVVRDGFSLEAVAIRYRDLYQELAG